VLVLVTNLFNVKLMKLKTEERELIVKERVKEKYCRLHFIVHQSSSRKDNCRNTSLGHQQ
jgi:hypothetical protein